MLLHDIKSKIAFTMMAEPLCEMQPATANSQTA
jgi:hypothetical protein